MAGWQGIDGNGQWWREGNTIKHGNGGSTIAMGNGSGGAMDGGTTAQLPYAVL
jgi:hypothetical protein